MKSVIIDDEAKARSALRLSLQIFCPSVEVIGEADGVNSGWDIIKEKKPQLVFLDIHINGGIGFELLDKFEEPKFKVIFITAYDEFAIKAFRYNAIDYLLKPIDPEELVDAVKKISQQEKSDILTEQINNLLEVSQKKVFDKIALTTSEGTSFLKLKDIIKLVSDGSYTTFHTHSGEEITVSRGIKEYETLLPSDTFCRIHQSYIVNIDFVKKILKEDGGYVLLESDDKVPISRRKKNDLMELMKSKMLK